MIIDGFIKVEHGKVIVGNPYNGGKVPTIKAKPPVKLFVDGNEISKETKVSSESTIEWEIEDQPLFEISVLGDKINAYLTINRTFWRFSICRMFFQQLKIWALR